MSRIEGLLKAYGEFVAQPWPANLAGAEKVWFAIYDPAQERRLLFRIAEFETITRRTGHGWCHLDISNLFAEWMGQHKYREAYFDDPEAMDLALKDFADVAAERLREALTAPDAGDTAVVAVSGVGALFGLARTADVVGRVTSEIHGRLLIFFPGRHENGQYRLLDARDGWNYLAVPIIAKNED